METNQPDPPHGVRGQLNSRFEQQLRTGARRRCPIVWFHKLAGYREPIDEMLARQQAKRERRQAEGER